VTTERDKELDLEAVRGLLEGLVEQGRGKEAVGLAVELLGRIRQDNTALERRLFQLLRERYGRKSERVSAEQLKLFLDQIVEDVPEGAKPAGDVPQPKRKPRDPGGHKGRQPLPAHLPREPHDVPVPDSERHCPECGSEKKTIGFVESEVLEFRPAQFVVEVARREKIACPKCQAHVSVADDDKLAPRLRPGAGLLADLIVGKWQDSLPLERQADRYKRLDVQLAPSTLGDWVAYGIDALAPIARRITQLVLLSSYIQADDTTLKVLDPERKPAVKRGHIWAFVGMDVKLTAYLYAPDWTAEHPGELLADYTGYLQGDGYAGFDKILERPDEDTEAPFPIERRLGCGMHIRRRFENAAKLGDARGAIAMAFFRKLYATEDACKEEGLSHEQRHQRRQSESLPIVAELYEWVGKLHPTLVPSSKIYDATRYALKQKDAWVRCFTDGRFEIDNGEVERQLRRVSLGRKNYLFAGSDDGAVRAAIAYTVLACCRMHDVDPFAYVRDVLKKLADGWPQAKLDELLPHKWAPPPTNAD
jgi:transposase